MSPIRWILLAASVAGSVFAGLTSVQPPAVDPLQPAFPAPKVGPKVNPKQPAKPAPLCPGPNCPNPNPNQPKQPKRPRWGDCQGPAVAGQSTTYGEPEPAVDLLSIPKECRRANISSRGLGCCTFRSAEYASWWQNEPALHGLPEWMKEQGIAGGGTPTKQAEIVRRIAQARNLPVPKFVQYEGRDPSIIELALRTGRVPCITWQGNHMLVCVYLDGERAAILDNNDPDRLHWYSRDDFVRKWTAGGGGWVFLLLASPPPPPPAGTPPAAAVYAQKRCPCSPQCCCGCNEGQPCRCGNPEPDDARPARPDYPAGVEWSYQGAERYTAGGRVVTRDAVFAELTDDTAKLHLTVIGTAEERAAARAEIATVADRYHVQEYEPTAWQVACGFVTGPGPVVYLQARDGTPLLRRHGAEGLVGALRRRDPNYVPEKDPDGSPPPTAIPGTDITWQKCKDASPWAAGGSLLVMLLSLLFKGGQQPPPTPAAPQHQPAPAPAPVPVQVQPAPVPPAQPSLDELLRQFLVMELASRRRSPTPGDST